MNSRQNLVLAAAVAAVIIPGIASAQSKVYPPEADCANQPTIAERLLCGRQEFRRQQGVSVETPNGLTPGEPGPFPDQPMPPAELRPAPGQAEELEPNTASPNH
ncbi:hypothetical protein [Dongia sp.]|uniref:hypothetical protein n=1 Tax=Dongia sp. TaxID=1977262 RepID=UPI0037525410